MTLHENIFYETYFYENITQKLHRKFSFCVKSSLLLTLVARITSFTKFSLTSQNVYLFYITLVLPFLMLANPQTDFDVVYSLLEFSFVFCMHYKIKFLNFFVLNHLPPYTLVTPIRWQNGHKEKFTTNNNKRLLTDLLENVSSQTTFR